MLRRWGITILVGSLAYLVVFDRFWVCFWDSEPQITRHYREVGNRRAVVLVNGAFGAGSLHAKAIQGVLKRDGDLISADYARQRFEPDRFVEYLHRWLVGHGYREVTYVGLSMGGDLVADLVAYNYDHGRPLTLRVTLQDVPHGAATLKAGSFAKLTRWVQGGLIWNTFPTKLWWRIAFQPEPESARGPGANAKWIEADYASTRTWPLSSGLAMMRYSAGYQLPPTEKLRSVVSMAYVMSTQDTKVLTDPAATARFWLDAFGSTHLVEADMPHTEVLTHPVAAGSAFQIAALLHHRTPWPAAS